MMSRRRRKKGNWKVIGVGKPCPKCGRLMQRRAHKAITPKLLRKTYFYTEWDVCKSPCPNMEFYEKYKVVVTEDLSENWEAAQEFMRKHPLPPE
jgi:hypothetical protein